MRRVLGTTLGIMLIGLSACSEDSSQPQVEPEPAPAAPNELTPNSVTPTSVTLSWRDVSTDETGFRIERSAAGANDFQLAGNVNANVQVFIDRTVTADQSYDYRVRAVRTGVESQPSETVRVTAKTNAAPSVPGSPTPENRLQELDPNSTVVLSWNASDPDGDTLLYDVYFGSTFASLSQVSDAQTSTEYALTTTFEPNRSYFWQVVVTDGAGIIRRSPVWVFSTVIERVDVPEGPFVMGAPSGEFFHPGNPISTRSYDIDRFEITNAQYVNYLNQARELRLIKVTGGIVYDAAGIEEYADVHQEVRQGSGDLDSALRYASGDSLFFVLDGWDNFPVVQVSWFGARAYADFFGRDLPTEAEWEKAARGTSVDLGTETYFAGTPEEVTVGVGFPYPWGADADNSRGNFDNSGDPFENQARVRSTPVGYYDGSIRAGYQTTSGASIYGCEDLSGNVWEWTQDAYDIYRAPHEPPQIGHYRMIRGGDYDRGIGSATCWNRSFARPEIRDRGIGFRTVSARPE
ncbi:MAG: SUMF1/EgtB/PvdO family nonheme iron enzyme [Candidatus Eisenbacteria bacterium]